MRPERQEQSAADEVHSPLVDVRRRVPPPEHGGPRADRVADDPSRGDAFGSFFFVFFLRVLGRTEKVSSEKKKEEEEKRGGEKTSGEKQRERLKKKSSPQTLAVVASPMVATWLRSPHSARKVSVKASRTTAGTTEAAAKARVSLAAASAEEGFAAAAAAAAAVPARFGEVPLCLSVSSRSTSSSSFSHS